MSSPLDQSPWVKLDQSEMRSHLLRWTDTFLEWYRQAAAWALPAHFGAAKRLVFSGMGGSGQAGAIIKDLALATSPWPIELIKDYTLPKWVDHETVVIAVTYSGGTEETLSTIVDAHEAGAKVMILTTGGGAASLARKYKIPCFEHDYQSQPRVALPVHLAILLNIADRLGLLKVNDAALAELPLLGARLAALYDPETSVKENTAKGLAQELTDKIPVVVGDGVLAGVAGRWKAQFNENAKSAAYLEIIPEMNHNALLGTSSPDARKDLFWLLLDSAFTHEQNKNRMVLTDRFLKSKRLLARRLSWPANDPLLEVVEALIFGDWVSFYLAMLRDVDPTPVPGIHDFKKQLER